MGLFKKILGICDTQPPIDPTCCAIEEGKAVVDISKAPELSETGGGFRLEMKGLSKKILVFRGDDDKYYAVQNKCTHTGGRRLDPIAGTSTVKCCSIGGSTFDYSGKRLAGLAKKPITILETKEEDGKLIIEL